MNLTATQIEKRQKMSKKEIFYSVEQVPTYFGYGDKFETFEEAEKEARSSAWRYGKDYYVMGRLAVAKAPKEIVNSVVVEKVTT